MKMSKVLALAASALVAGAASAGVTVYPGDTLGTLSPLPALYGDLKSTSDPLGGSFSDNFSFNLAALSDVTGSVGKFFGGVTFSSVLIDSTPVTLTSTDTGYGFSLADVSAGSHTLTVKGLFDKGGNAYVGSLYATGPVPEPGSVALMLGGVGVIGLMAARRRRQD